MSVPNPADRRATRPRFGGGKRRAAAAERALSEIARALSDADHAERRGETGLARRLRQRALDIATAASPDAPTAPRGVETREVVPGPAFPPAEPAPAAPGAAGAAGAAVAASGLPAAVARGYRLAKRPALHRADVQKLFGSRDEGKRVMALAIIQKRPELGGIEILLGAIAQTKSASEQVQGLEAARAAVEAGRLGGEELTALREEIRGRMTAGTLGGEENTRLAERILGA